MWSGLISGIRFTEPLESEFRLRFSEMGRKSRHEMWAVLLIAITMVLLFHHILLRVPAEVLPLGRTLLAAVAIPMVLRWLSGDHSPTRRWSSVLYVASTYIDVGCLMALRIACIRNGLDVVPLVMPLCILLSLIVVQIRFILLAPAILTGLVAIVMTELWAFDAASNELFEIAAIVAVVFVALGAAYELERSIRTGWLRERELAELTRTDALTGLPNRRYLDGRLADLARAATHDRRTLAVMALDIDDFKAFNDRHGHLAGDNCLRRIGGYLARSMNGADEFCARLGGEEFVAVWSATAASEIPGRAEEIRSGVAQVAVGSDAASRLVTASAGLACQNPGAPESIADLMTRADSALYRAKREGRDRLAVADRHTVRASPRPTAPSATIVRQPPTVTPSQEAEFQAEFYRQGLRARLAMLVGFDAVGLAVMSSQQRLLRIPDEANALGLGIIVFGILPVATVAAITIVVPRLRRWSTPAFIIAVAVIISAQMAERVVQLPHGYNVIPFLMPASALLGMCVAKLRFGVLVPSALVILIALSAVELWVFPWTGNRLLTVGTSAFMVAVTTRFAYKLERSIRQAWLEQRKLSELTRIDPLTGLPNRRSLDAAWEEVTGPAWVSVLALDIDGFKGFNDRYGHPAGDDALRAVGEYLRRAMAHQDVLVARVGGEEFTALWHGQSGGRRTPAEVLRGGITALGPLAGTETTLTASAGFAEMQLTVGRPDRQAFQYLVDCADRALYEAKNQGRNQLVDGSPDAAIPGPNAGMAG